MQRGRVHFMNGDSGGDIEIGMRGLGVADGGGGFKGDILEGLDVDVFFGSVGLFLFGLLLTAFAFFLVLDAVDAGVGEVFNVLGVLEIFGGLNLAGANGVVALTLNGREGGGYGGLGDHRHRKTLIGRRSRGAEGKFH